MGGHDELKERRERELIGSRLHRTATRKTLQCAVNNVYLIMLYDSTRPHYRATIDCPTTRDQIDLRPSGYYFSNRRRRRLESRRVHHLDRISSCVPRTERLE